eukprot:TRINITY_DN1414_c1_g8_i3.p1 TRINITY_DN1414_c1_g8~~TRINITY_DN1414_c1_g8_i3.p1  ORF type:complete len:861 (-),score=273.09 TRINITY_DN1414_c1_g8_i3:118-2490(-)
MLKRSLSTFMNAMTAYDWTVYPFASMNEKDYNNLLKVYCDAAFFPKLTANDFSQEGHRLEKDENDKLVRAGVVFNEMKGHMSDAGVHFHYCLMRNLFEGSTYSNVSGGDPVDIPNLTHEQLLEFHHKHYHPSNALFVSYGSFDCEERLKFLEETVLTDFERNPDCDNIETIPIPKRWVEARHVTVTGPHDPLAGDKQDRFCVAMPVCRSTDRLKCLQMSVLSSMLMDGPASPMYQALIASGLAAGYECEGFSNDTLDATFSVGVQGVRSDDIDKIEEVINKTIEEASKKPFDRQRVDATLAQIELNVRTLKSDFGLNATFAAAGEWVHGEEPDVGLGVSELLESLRSNLEDDMFLSNLLKEMVVENDHKLWLHMKPDEEYFAKLENYELGEIAEIESNLTPTQLKSIEEKQAELAAIHSEPQDPSCLPEVTVADVNLNVSPSNTLDAKMISQNVPLHWVDQPSNGIVHLRALLDLSIPFEDLQWVPNAGMLLSGLGTSQHDYMNLDTLRRTCSSGLHVSPVVRDTNESRNISLLLQTDCLPEHLPQTLDLLGGSLNDLQFDSDRVKAMILSKASALQGSISHNGHRYAMMRAASAIDDNAAIREQLSGMEQIWFASQLAENSDAVDLMCEQTTNILSSANNIQFGVVSPEADMALIEPCLKNFIETLPSSMTRKTQSTIKSPLANSNDIMTNREFVNAPVQIHFGSRAFKAPPRLHPDGPALAVAARIMRAKWLHPEIREQGGAYGSGAVNSAGNFAMFSYFDPHTDRTQGAFDHALEALKNGEFNEKVS